MFHDSDNIHYALREKLAEQTKPLVEQQERLRFELLRIRQQTRQTIKESRDLLDRIAEKDSLRPNG